MKTDSSPRSSMLAAAPALRAFALSLCGNADRANDLVQETYVRALANLDKFRPGTNMAAWLTVILRNRYYSECRKRAREVEDVDGAYASTLACEADQSARLDHEGLWNAVLELPSDVQQAVILVGASGASYEEAAAACRCAVGTIKSRMHRARARLATRLAS